jgi:DNA polymerase I
MKLRFYLLDINEDHWQDIPCVRLWGLNEKSERVVILATQILPYFYVRLGENADYDSMRARLIDRNAFLGFVGVNIETKKLMGRDCRVLRIICPDSEFLPKSSKEIGKISKEAEIYEADVRLPLRYLIDAMLTPCGWHECAVDDAKLEGVTVDHAFVASELPRNISDDAVPKLRILAFVVLTAAEKGSAKPEKDPVRAIAAVTDSGTTTTLISEGQDDSRVLEDFATFLNESDPDVIVGFESNSFGWPYLIQRSRLRKTKLTVGRDGSEPHTSVYGHVSVTGRANLDLFDVAGGFPEIKVKSLENLAKYLQIPTAKKVTTVEESDLYGLWQDKAGRQRLIEYLNTNALAALELARATINFPMQLSVITGIPLDHVMTAAVGFRVDSYLIRQAHQVGELIPPKNEQPFFTYRGAIVLEPKTGLHDNIAVLDFSSMYPTLMMNWNLSPDTYVKPGERVAEDSVYIIPDLKHRFRKTPDGFYKIVLSTLIQERAVIGRELKEFGERSIRYRVLKERERAVKVITNACYGYAGWAGARWYVREVAESATALGRQAITKTIEKAESLGLNVIYGDTDSIFVKNDQDKIKALRKWATKELGLDIRSERVYIRVLFTEAMKRYAGLLSDGSLDIVGLEVVRGDWSDIARQVQEEVLESILRDQSTEQAIERVRTTIRRLKNGEVPITDLTIRKTLTKPIEDYAVRTPHVEVAKKLLKQGWDLGLGDKVGYVIAKGPGKLFQKATPFNQIKPDEVDTDYYLENQLKPAAMRILERFGVNENQLVV